MDTAPVLEFARSKLDELFATPAFKKIHKQVSVVLVGSHMMDQADEYSDVDIFIYVPDSLYAEARTVSIEHGIMQTDGDWLLYYRDPYEVTLKVWSMSELHQQFRADPITSVATLTSRKIWQDPASQFGEVVAEYDRRFEERLPWHIKDKSLWLRVRIKQAILVDKRGLSVSERLLRADFVKLLYEIAFLLHGRPYCHLKWLERRSTEETELGRRAQPIVAELVKTESVDDCIRLMKQAYLLAREVATGLKAPDPTLVNPEGDMATRVFESAFISTGSETR